MFADIESFVENILKFEHKAKEQLLSEYRTHKSKRKTLAKIKNIRKPIKIQQLYYFTKIQTNFLKAISGY